MDTLLCSQKSPFFHLPKPTSWSQMMIPTNFPKEKTPTNVSTASWKLHANAKGFSSTTQPKPSSTIQEISTKKSSNKKNSKSNNDDDDDLIPEAVFNRIIARVCAFVGVPMVLGFVSMYVLSVIMEQKVFDVPKWFQFIALFITFGASACGIAYGALSTSWDPNKKGSLLGFEQVQQNWVEMWKEEDEGKTSWDD